MLLILVLHFQAIQTKDKSRIGKSLYYQFDTVAKFTVPVRQQGSENEKFREILQSVAAGKLSLQNWEHHLCPRELKKLPNKEWFIDNATKLCATNASCKGFNIDKLKKLGKPIAQVKAINRGPGSKDHPTASSGNLRNTILLAEGCKVMCTYNLAKNLGIVNGKVAYFYCTIT